MTDTLERWSPTSAPRPGPKVSALAVVALVLSVLWVYGLGSLVGAIVGAVALWRIRHSRGRLRGRLVAWLALGWGVLGLAVTVGGLVWFVTHFTLDFNGFGRVFTPKSLDLGQTGTYSDTGAGSPRSATTYFVSYPSPSANAAPTPGTEDAVVEVGVCAGAQAYTPAATQSEWAVETNPPSDTAAAPWGGTAPMIDVTSPGLSVAAHTCGHGSIVFAVPAGSTVTAVMFTDLNDGALPFYRWTVPQH